MTNHTDTTLPTYRSIVQKTAALAPTFLQLENESRDHAGYFDGKESHFKLTIVSADFDGVRMVARHQKVYALLGDLLRKNGGTIHALAIAAFTPDEYATTNATPKSPTCKGIGL